MLMAVPRAEALREGEGERRGLSVPASGGRVRNLRHTSLETVRDEEHLEEGHSAADKDSADELAVE